MADVRTLKGRAEAQVISEQLLVAYWLNETPEQPGYHLDRAHQEFLLLAEALGYDVTRTVEEAA